MKKQFLLFCCIFLLLLSCKKNAQETVLFSVKEYKTNIPLPAANIQLLKCSDYDAVFGCQSIAAFATYTTDAKGNCSIPQTKLNGANQGIMISKAQYWDKDGSIGENQMEPEAWVSIALTASQSYSANSYFELKTSGEIGGESILSFKAPRDSIIRYRLFGNQMNNVNWVLYIPKPTYLCLLCGKDTLAYGNLTFSPQKLETLTSALSY